MDMVDARERLKGYKKAMGEAGIPVTEDMIYYGDYWRRQGEKIVNYFIKDNTEYPEVIICSNDYMAVSVSDELKARGIRIPEDISVVGYDGIRIGRHIKPQLTTLKQDTAAIGRQAGEKLISLIEHPKTTLVEQTVIKGDVYEGEIVGYI